MPLFSPLHQHLKKESADRQQQIAKEIEKRQGKSATYTVPLLGSGDSMTPPEHQQQDVESFLSEFYCHGIFDKGREMRALLQQNPATIGTHYALLVPNVVSFDEFWSRYFFRCSATTILEELRVAAAAEHEELDEDDEDADAKNNQKDEEGAPHSPAAVVERTFSGRGNFLKRQLERGLGAIARSHSGSSTDSADIYQAALAQVEVEDAAAAATAAASQRAEIFRSEEDTDFIETIDEFGENGDDSCVSEEDVMIGGAGSPALVDSKQEEENEYFEEQGKGEQDAVSPEEEEESAPISSHGFPPLEEKLVTEPL